MADYPIYISINGTETAIKDLKDLEKVTQEVAKGFDEAGEAAKDAEKEVKKLGGGSKIGKGFKSIGDLGKKAFKGIGTAIKASGIGLLVTIVAKLIEEFMKTDTAAKLLQGSLAVLGVVFEKIQQAIDFLLEYGVKVFQDPQVAVEDLRAGVEALGNWFSSLGDYIKNNFILLFQNMRAEILEARIAWNNFTGDSEEAQSLTAELEELNSQMETTRDTIAAAAEEVKEPFVEAANLIANVVTEIVKESQQAIAASNAAIDAANAFADLQNRLIVENAELTKQLEEQKKISEDTTLSYEERKEALDQVNAANEQLVANALLEAQANEELIKQQLSIVSNDEDRRALQAELAAATAERIAREQEYSIVQLESGKLSRELDQEELDRKQAINDQLEALRVENITNEQEAALEGLRIAEEAALRELELLNATETEKQALRDAFAVKRGLLAEDEAEKQKQLEKDVQDAKVAVATQSLQALGELAAAFSGDSEKAAKRNFKIQKALSLASASISGTEAVINAYKTALGSPITTLFPAYPNIQAGLAAAFAAAQIATIAKTKFQSAAQPDAGSASTGAGGINPGGIQYNLGAGGGGEDVTLDNTTQQEPIKAYVIANDVTNAQQANAQIENLSTL